MPKRKTETMVRLREVIGNELGVEMDRVHDEARVVEDLGADSLDVVEVVMAVEDEFGVEITDEDAEGFQTVGDVRRWLEEHVG